MVDTPMLLHIYGQGAWHDEAIIVGTHDALSALREAITHALLNGVDTGTCGEVFCADGEGYGVQVILADKAEMEKYCLPYTDPIANDKTGQLNAHWPRRVFG